jgi:hypothetical protein
MLISPLSIVPAHLHMLHRSYNESSQSVRLNETDSNLVPFIAIFNLRNKKKSASAKSGE